MPEPEIPIAPHPTSPAAASNRRRIAGAFAGFVTACVLGGVVAAVVWTVLFPSLGPGRAWVATPYLVAGAVLLVLTLIRIKRVRISDGRSAFAKGCLIGIAVVLLLSEICGGFIFTSSL